MTTVAQGGLFRPTSMCGAACLSPSASRSHMLRRWVRSTAGAVVLASTAVAAAVVSALPRSAQGRAARTLLRRSARMLLAVLGVTSAGTGTMPTSRALVVANHVSWIDILGLLALGDVRIVAKSEVEAWPVIGRLARLSGTIFIDRERPRTLPATVAEIREVLREGGVVAVFAEGTTTCGDHAVPYRPALFQAAIDAGARVVPVSLRYRLPDGVPTRLASFIGDETLVTSLRRVLGMPGVRLDLRVGASLHPQPGASRRLLARVAESATPSVNVVVPFPTRQTWVPAAA